MAHEDKVPEQVGSYNRRQQLFIRYFSFILIDLVVLNLADEFSDRVTITSFAVSLLTAMVLQLMLKVTFRIEHHIGQHITRKSGKYARLLRPLAAWGLLFASKFAILGAINFFFGDYVMFSGALHGVVAFIVVLVVMLVVEIGVTKLLEKLG